MIDHAKEIQELDKQIDCLDNELFEVRAELKTQEERAAPSFSWNAFTFGFCWFASSWVLCGVFIVAGDKLPVLNNFAIEGHFFSGIVVGFFVAISFCGRDRKNENMLKKQKLEQEELLEKQARLDHAITTLQDHKKTHQTQLAAQAKERAGQLSLSDPTTPAGALTETDHTE